MFLFSLGVGRSQSPMVGPKMNTKVAFNTTTSPTSTTTTTHHTKLFDQFQTSEEKLYNLNLYYAMLHTIFLSETYILYFICLYYI